MTVKLSSWRRRTGRALLTALPFVLAPDVRPVLAQAEAKPDITVFTVIVTRHGVRSFSIPAAYTWANWSPVVNASDLTAHGYRLMKLMGQFYKTAQADKGLPVTCVGPAPTAYVYADTAQRTLGTAHALIEGLCGLPITLPVFHTASPGVSDPIFDASGALANKIDAAASRAAVAAVAGSPPSSIVMRNADSFAAFQKLLDTRCGAQNCPPITSAASTIGGKGLAALGGPVSTASTYAEDVFLEFAQCRPEKQLSSLPAEQLRATLDAGMRLHVAAYDVNARNAYNPLVSGGTLVAHIAAMLDRKAGRTILDAIAGPDLGAATLVIISGHDTQLGELGGILSAHWAPGGGIMPDDMPPGAALIFDLVKRTDGDYGVRLRLAAMAPDRYRVELPFTGPLTPVTYTGCPTGDCIMPLAQFESLALTLQAQGLVIAGWNASSAKLPQDPVSAANLKDPTWTESQCGG